MSLIRKPGEFIFRCNECGEEIIVHDEDDLRDATRQIKEDGWEIIKDVRTGEWAHYCPDEQQ